MEKFLIKVMKLLQKKYVKIIIDKFKSKLIIKIEFKNKKYKIKIKIKKYQKMQSIR